MPDPAYFGLDAIDLWKSWLYAFPELKPLTSEERTAAIRARKICNQDCGENWLDYAEILEQWAVKERLNKIAKKRFLKEVEQIRKTSENCRQ